MTIIYFILILGITVFIHELGHFIFAKRAGIYVYEFSLGMGPVLYKRKSKKDETYYCIRLLPIGGFVSMAGEDVKIDKSIPDDKQLFNKPWLDRLLVIIAGVMFNFLLAFVLLVLVGIKAGYTDPTPKIGTLDVSYPIYESNIQIGDTILKIDGKKTKTVDDVMLRMQIGDIGDSKKLTVKHPDGNIETVEVKPLKINTNGVDSYRYGLSLADHTTHDLLSPIKYAFYKFGSLMKQMWYTLGFLITGQIKLNNLAGPVGIYNIVGETAKSGLINLIYLTAYLCINVGVINIIPIPAFDGGRLLFLIIEKIKGSPVDPKVENKIHAVGMIILMLLMVLITYNDILRLFK